MYGVAGERRLQEYELPWLEGYEGSTPVRIGNGASDQFQLDVYGEVMDMMFHTAEALEKPLPEDSWALCRMLVEHVAKVWRDPDDGIWEVRGPRRHFVHSKVMAWVAVDRWVKLCELERPAEPLGPLASTARRDPRRRSVGSGWNDAVGSFTQYYGCDELDASLLMLALVGLPAARRPAHRRHHRGRSSASSSSTGSCGGTAPRPAIRVTRSPMPTAMPVARRTARPRSTACRPVRARSS